MRALVVTYAVIASFAPPASAAQDNLKAQREANELYLAGVAAYEKDDFEGAIKKFEACLALDPANAHAQFNVGVSYNDLGETDKALEAYRKVLTIDPHYGDAYFNIGRVYHLRKDFAAAVEYYEKARAEESERYSPDVLFNYAHALMENGRVDEAVDAWHAYLTVAEPLPDEAKWVERAKEYMATLEDLKSGGAGGGEEPKGKNE